MRYVTDRTTDSTGFYYPQGYIVYIFFFSSLPREGFWDPN